MMFYAHYNRLFYLLIWLLLPLIAFGQGTDELDEQNGFFKVQLGAEIDTLPNMKLLDNHLKKQRYEKTDIAAVFSVIPIEKAYFYFYRKRLHSIHIRVLGKEASDQFLDYLTLLYGTGNQETIAQYYTWEGKYVKLVYEQNMLTRNATIVFTSKEIDNYFKLEYRVVSE
jgi:hypothetical protein